MRETLPHRLHLDPDFFREQALAVLTRQRDLLLEHGGLFGSAARLEAITGVRAETCISSVRNELVRCERALAAIEGQRVG